MRSNRRTVINAADPDINLSTISLLIPKCKEGDNAARENLLSEISGFLKLVADQNMDPNLRQKIGTSDIVQNSLIKLIEHFEQFNGGTSIELRGWLKRIVVNEIHSKRRAFATARRNTQREESIEPGASGKLGRQPQDPNLTPSSSAIAKERVDRFYQALDCLSEDHATVIRLRNLDRLSFKEIGEIMGRSEDAVSKLWYRAILNFEEKFKKIVEK